MDADGADPRQITNDAGADPLKYVAWSADDQTLLVSVGDAEQAQIMTVPVAGRELAPFIPAPAAYAAVAADGRIVFSTIQNGGLGIVSADPSGAVTGTVVSGPDDEDVASISPDGTLVAYDAGNTGSRRVEYAGIDGSNPQQLAAPGADASNPVWSPNGTQLALVSDDGAGNQSVWVIGLDGSRTELTGIAPHEKVWHLSWTP